MDDGTPAPPETTDPEVPAEPSFADRRFFVTPSLVVLNAAVLFAMVFQSASLAMQGVVETNLVMVTYGANFGPFTFNGEWWRLLSSTFLHFDIVHLAFNMWILWHLGSTAERLFGNGRFLSIYLLSGIGGSVASLLWHPVVISAGASGAVFGIAGALAAFLAVSRLKLPEPAARQLLIIVVIFVAFSLASGLTTPGVDNAGHVGGLVVGALLGAALRYPRAFPAAVAVSVLGLIASASASKTLARDNPELILAEARLLTINDHDKAIQKAQQAVSEHPTLAAGHSLLGELYLENSRYRDAIAASRQALEIDPEDPDAQRVLGMALYWAGDHEAAAVELKKTIAHDPKQLAPHALLGRALRALGEDAEAAAALAEGLKYAPAPSLLFRSVGFDSLEPVELEFLIAALKEEIAITPEEAEHYNVLSLVLARAGAHDEALTTVEKALELRPEAPHIIDSLGTVHFYRDELDDAIVAYRKAVEMVPRAGVYHYNLSLALRRRGDIDAADAELAEAYRLDSNLAPPADGQPMM